MSRQQIFLAISWADENGLRVDLLDHFMGSCYHDASGLNLANSASSGHTMGKVKHAKV